MVAHVLTIWAAGPGRFNGRVGNNILARATPTPFHDSAAALLAAGLAQPDDLLTMRYADRSYTVMEATVAKAAATNVEPRS
jgi:hypothetical protein